LRGTTPFRWELLLKVGGSLGQRASLRPLLQRIALLAGRRRLLVVPGGGLYADLVRDQMRRRGIDERTAHHMALLAMDQYGLFLSSLMRRSAAVDNLRTAELVAEAGRVPILLASSLVRGETTLERSFRLTSDSIAAYLAGRLRAAHLVLLKSVSRPPGRLRDRASADRLARHGVVDPLFAGMMPATSAIWVLNGRRPSELDRFMPIVRRDGAGRRPATARPVVTARSGHRSRRRATT